MTIKDEFLMRIAYLKEVIKEIINDIRGPKPPSSYA